jgi:hypothetical protein
VLICWTGNAREEGTRRALKAQCEPVGMMHAYVLNPSILLQNPEPRENGLSPYASKNGPVKRYLCYSILNETDVWRLATSYKLTKSMKASPRNNLGEMLVISAMNIISFVEYRG